MRKLACFMGACCALFCVASFAAETPKGATGSAAVKGATGEVGMRGATGNMRQRGTTGPLRQKAATERVAQKGDATDEDFIDESDVYAIPLDKSPDEEEAEIAKLKGMQKQKSTQTNQQKNQTK